VAFSSPVFGSVRSGVEDGADGERREQRVQRRQQQGDRQPPGGQQVARHAGRLAEPPHRLDADHRGRQQGTEEQQVTRADRCGGQFPADERQIAGQHD
jgi:hypothetical protein